VREKKNIGGRKGRTDQEINARQKAGGTRSTEKKGNWRHLYKGYAGLKKLEGNYQRKKRRDLRPWIKKERRGQASRNCRKEIGRGKKTGNNEQDKKEKQLKRPGGGRRRKN